MSRVPALTRMVPRSPPSRTLRAACGGGLRPSLTAPTPDTHALSGRGEETAPISRTKKHHRQKPKQLLHSLTDATWGPDRRRSGPQIEMHSFKYFKVLRNIGGGVPLRF